MPYEPTDWHKNLNISWDWHTESIKVSNKPKDKVQELGIQTHGMYKPRSFKFKKKRAETIATLFGLKVKFLKPLDLFDTTTLKREKKGDTIRIVGINLYTGKKDILAVIRPKDKKK